MKKIIILLSTYNGEKFLRAQLDSLLAQTYEDIAIYARDDGSGDATLQILKEYVSRAESVGMEMYILDTGTNLGYPDCFWYLLRQCPDAAYYAFCDQDDCWHPDKLKRAVEMLERESEQTPLLYTHNYENCDKDLKVMSIHRTIRLGKGEGYRMMFYSMAPGFSMVINHSLRQLLLSQQVEEKQLPHDGWCMWTAYYRGKILYDTQILTQYRRHEKAVTSSGMRKSAMISSWIHKEILGDEMTKLRRRIQQFYDWNKDALGAEKTIWKRYGIAHRGIIAYFARLFYPKRLRPSLGGELALRILLLLGK